MVAIDRFLDEAGMIVDVRSPGEFRKGHIPGAVNIPLLNDEERAIVGTLYKQKSPEEAFDEGLRLVSPKLPRMVAEARALGERKLRVHCWRGGMRSSFVSILLNYAGMDSITLDGGYKAFRRWTLDSFSLQKRIVIVGGLTGSGKTAILHQLKQMNEQVLDLEALANHCGSAFGYMGAQPTIEHFENKLALAWRQLDSERPIWVEDESRQIGTCQLPLPLYHQMKEAPFFVVDRPDEERIERLLLDYGDTPIDSLVSSTQRIHKRLGSERTKAVITNLESGKMREAFTLLLQYYDKAYRYTMKQRNGEIDIVSLNGCSDRQWAETLLSRMNCYVA